MKSLVLVTCMLLPLSCKDQGTPPEQHQSPVQLSLLDVGTVDATLKIHLDSGVLSRQLVLRRDGETVSTLRPVAADTIVWDYPLKPSSSYAYKTYLLNGETTIDSSDGLVVPTGDSSSHTIQWITDTVGTGYSYLKDVAIISDGNIWAVGELYKRDTLGQIDPVQYNLSRWNGGSWSIERVMFPICDVNGNEVGTAPFTITSIHALGPNDIWLSSGGSLVHWNGATFNRRCLLSGTILGQINALFGTSNNRFYAVGNNGTIIYYNGSTWQRQASGTTVNLLDVWGTPDGREVWACGWENSGGTVILRRANGVWQTIWDEQAPRPPFVYHGLIGTVYAPNNTTVFLSGSGDVFQQSLLNLALVRQHPVDLVNYAYRIRGSAINDVWLAGDFAMLWHWNGSTWYRCTDLTNTNDRLYGLAVSSTTVVAVGTRYGGISRTGLIIRGRR